MNQWLDLVSFQVSCEAAGVAVPASIERGLELIAIAQQQSTMAPRPLLELADSDVADWVTESAIRAHNGSNGWDDSNGMTPGVDAFVTQVTNEVRDAVLPELEFIIVEQQPRFEELAAPLVAAAQRFGFTGSTSSDHVIDLADEDASAAWRATKPAMAAIEPIARFRVKISTMFDLSPTAAESVSNAFDRTQIARAENDGIDYSICFAAEHNWSTDGAYYLEGRGKARGQLDWIALAAGGLRLNTPDEVVAKRKAKAAALRAVAP